MRNIDEPLLNTIANIMAAGGKVYCVPSNAKLLEILAKRYNIVITERTLHRHLVELERKGYIWRQARWDKTRNNLPRRLSTIIHFTNKAAYYINNFNYSLSKHLLELLSPFNSEIQKATTPPKVEDVIKQREDVDAHAWLDEINKIIGFRKETVVV